jgi:hypothetical protein
VPPYKQLYILVEGLDDVRFFQRILQPLLEQRYSEVKILAYAKMKLHKVEQMVKSFKAMQADYIFVADNDQAPCVTAKKVKLQAKYTNLTTENIIITIEEIEGWYLAGLKQIDCEQLKFKHPGSTDSLTKEAFRTLQPKRFVSALDFMVELLKYFSVETARENNKAFSYFFQKYLL